MNDLVLYGKPGGVFVIYVRDLRASERFCKRGRYPIKVPYFPHHWIINYDSINYFTTISVLQSYMRPLYHLVLKQGNGSKTVSLVAVRQFQIRDLQTSSAPDHLDWFSRTRIENIRE